MKPTRIFRLALIGLVLLAAAAPRAFASFDPIGEDIDIFLANPAVAAERPNVLIMLDNTANWNTAFDNEKGALVSVVNALTDAFNVGLMFYDESGQPVNHGSYVRFGIRQMTTTNKGRLSSIVNALDKLGDKGNNNTISEMINEAYLYWAGLTANTGFGQAKRDYFGNAGSNPLAADLPGNALPDATSQTYVSPITNGCQKNFQVYISNGPANENASTLSDMQARLALLVGKNPPDTITLSNVSPDSNGQQQDWMDEYAKFMANGDCNANFTGKQSVVTYVVEVDPGTTGQGPAMTTLMKSVAANGKGRYFAVSSAAGGAAIVAALNQIFQEVQSVNSVFASSTLPVSVNVRSTNLNQVYIGVFRPDSTKAPRWFGNLKLYDLKVNVSGDLFLADANGVGAADPNNGFIKNTATSFWTTTSNFWAYRSPFDSTDVGQNSDSPDGNLVEKGGAAEMLRVAYPASQVTRKLYTCTGTCQCSGNTCATPVALSGSPFATGNTDITAFGLGTLLTKSVTSLISVGNTAIATVALHGFNDGDSVVISGASPADYNGTYLISVVDVNTFRYSLLTSPSGNTATVSANAHGLNTGDLLDVSGSTEAGYNVTGASVTKVDANSFTYTLGAAVAAASSGQTVVGRKQIGSVSGIGTAATVTLPSHGYTTGNLITITGATPTEFNVTSKAITVTSTDTFTYTTNSTLTGSSTTAQGQTTVPHNFNTGDSVTVSCASPSAYTGTVSITVTGSNSFTYNLAAAQTTDATLTTAPSGCSAATNILLSKAGATLTGTGLTHANNGYVATFSFTSGTNPFTAGQSVTISGAQQTAYNGTFAISNVTATSFDYTPPAVSLVTTTPTNGTFNILSTPALPLTATITKCGGGTVLLTSIVHATSGSQSTQDTAKVTPAASLGCAAGSAQTLTISGTGIAAYDGTWTGTMGTGGSANVFSFLNEGVVNAARPATTLTSFVASGSVSRSIANTCGGGSSACLQRAITGTGTIYAGKTVTVISITSQTNATGTITAANQTSGDATGRANLINWIRGQDNKEDENSSSTSTDIRASVHGDVLHSRPAVINYNRGGAAGSNTGDNDVFAFYGGNDGILHALQGGFASNGGTDLWGFIAPEFFNKLKRLRDNAPIIGVASATASPRDYFFDGPIGSYSVDRNSDGKLLASDGDTVFMYVGMRRGGRYIYALDVSDPLTPKFMWKRGCPNLTDNKDCDAGFEELGQTWSEAKVAFLRAYGDRPVLIFGAGYDPAVEDFQPCLVVDATPELVTAQTGGSVVYTSSGSCTATGTTKVDVKRSMGRGIFIVDATTGDLLYRFGPDGSGANVEIKEMAYSMPADVVLLNRDRDSTRTLPGKENIQPLLSGFADRVYAVDTGGQVWRLDLDDADPTKWKVTLLAALAGSDLKDRRKFLFSPDVVFGSDASGPYDAVLVGSGDREHPFDATITDRFYMLKDRGVKLEPSGANTIVDATFDASTNPDGLFDATSNCLQDTTVCASGSSALNDAQNALLAAPGWKLTLGAGEKNVGTATTIAGTTFFNTNQPSASAGGGACGSNLGIARQYLVSFADATATTNLNQTSGLTTVNRSAEVPGGGYLPSPVPLIVEIDGKKYQGVCSGTQCLSPGGLKLEARVRSYWYRKIE